MQDEAYKKARSVFLSGLAMVAVGLVIALYIYLEMGGGSYSSLILIAVGVGRTLQGLAKMGGAKKENSASGAPPTLDDEDTRDETVMG